MAKNNMSQNLKFVLMLNLISQIIFSIVVLFISMGFSLQFYPSFEYEEVINAKDFKNMMEFLNK